MLPEYLQLFSQKGEKRKKFKGKKDCGSQKNKQKEKKVEKTKKESVSSTNSFITFIY